MLSFKCTNDKCSKIWTRLDGNGCRVCDAPCEVIALTRGLFVSSKTERCEELETIWAAMPDGREWEEINSHDDEESDESGDELDSGCHHEDYDEQEETDERVQNSYSKASDTDSISETNQSSKLARQGCNPSNDYNSQIAVSAPSSSLSSDPPAPIPINLSFQPANQLNTKPALDPTKKTNTNLKPKRNKPVRPGQHNTEFRRIMQQANQDRHIPDPNAPPSKHKKKKKEKSKAKLPLPDFLASTPTPVSECTLQQQQKQQQQRHQLPIESDSDARSWHHVVRKNAGRPLQDLESNRLRLQRPYASYLATVAGGAFGEAEMNGSGEGEGEEPWLVSFGMRGRKYDVRTVVARSVG